jgi:hypothetical protein
MILSFEIFDFLFDCFWEIVLFVGEIDNDTGFGGLVGEGLGIQRFRG